MALSDLLFWFILAVAGWWLWRQRRGEHKTADKPKVHAKTAAGAKVSPQASVAHVMAMLAASQTPAPAAPGQVFGTPEHDAAYFGEVRKFQSGLALIEAASTGDTEAGLVKFANSLRYKYLQASVWRPDDPAIAECLRSARAAQALGQTDLAKRLVEDAFEVSFPDIEAHLLASEFIGANTGARNNFNGQLADWLLKSITTEPGITGRTAATPWHVISLREEEAVIRYLGLRTDLRRSVVAASHAEERFSEPVSIAALVPEDIGAKFRLFHVMLPDITTSGPEVLEELNKVSNAQPSSAAGPYFFDITLIAKRLRLAGAVTDHLEPTQLNGHLPPLAADQPRSTAAEFLNFFFFRKT